MIERYSRLEMKKIFQEENKYALWLKIETAAAEQMAAMGQIPASLPPLLATVKPFTASDVARILEIEQTTKHDVIAFLTFIAEQIGEEARFLHQGLTSSDILDTTLALQLKQAGGLLQQGLARVLAALQKLSDKYKTTLTIGRSHGIHAEPVSFGFKMLGHYAAFARAQQRLGLAVAEIATCKLRGPVGTYSSVDPSVESYVAKKLGLAVEPHATQVIPRDRHAMFFATLAVIAGSIENLAVEIRHLQRTEVNEASEFFDQGQKGSSAMPHKKNPILSENLTGLARVIRAQCLPAMENIALWHERDISHSSVERFIVPDALVTLDFALDRLGGLLEKLQVNEAAIAHNMKKSHHLYYSGAILNALTQAGVSREAAYQLVQKLALQAWAEQVDFIDLVTADKTIGKYLSAGDIKKNCNDATYLKNIDHVYDLVYKK
ncbi:MAG: adenylosuccinate lyase [Hydrotalea sp.]|nr:adenylosuccinate lyase [Hydrotalea sp.]